MFIWIEIVRLDMLAVLSMQSLNHPGLDIRLRAYERSRYPLVWSAGFLDSINLSSILVTAVCSSYISIDASWCEGDVPKHLGSQSEIGLDGGYLLILLFYDFYHGYVN